MSNELPSKSEIRAIFNKFWNEAWESFLNEGKLFPDFKVKDQNDETPLKRIVCETFREAWENAWKNTMEHGNITAGAARAVEEPETVNDEVKCMFSEAWNSVWSSFSELGELFFGEADGASN